MVADLPFPPGGQRGDYVVRAPQAGDALAGSLRSAFGRDQVLPSDMARLLTELGGSGR